MKLHLPVILRKNILNCLFALAVSAFGNAVTWAHPLGLDACESVFVWDNLEDNKVFENSEGEQVAFSAGKDVNFRKDAEVTLGDDIVAGTVQIDPGASVTINMANYDLVADCIEISGTLDAGDILRIKQGTILRVIESGVEPDIIIKSHLEFDEGGVLWMHGTADMNGNSVTMTGDCSLIITSPGDGREYELFSNVSCLLDASGAVVELNSENCKIENFFSTDSPGSGFWKDGTLQLTEDGSLKLIRHDNEVKSPLTIESRTLEREYCFYESVECNNVTDVTEPEGRPTAELSLSNNGSISFEGNSATDGGAMRVKSVMIEGNGGAFFSGNQACAGGSIVGESVMMNNNGRVCFNGNVAEIAGGAIEGEEIIIDNNGSVEFFRNTVSEHGYGGAISAENLVLSNNYVVSFHGNSACSLDFGSQGGAIYGTYGDTITLDNNVSVIFSSNTSSSSRFTALAGAIYGGIGMEVSLSDNSNVSFSENTASGMCALGGAICGNTETNILMDRNGSVVFSGNKTISDGAEACGGAIYEGYESFISLKNNGSVEFNENMVFSTGYLARGGAIDCPGTIEINDNGSVTFRENHASVESMENAYGGAIYTVENLNICNNDSVLFEKNVEKVGDTYRLRSIYAGGSGCALSLSAAAGKSIEFRDSVYVGSGSTVNLNADYTYLDDDGVSVTVEQKGDILFTGATTVDDLYEVKGKVYGTDEEVLASRTTEVNALTNLYGGRLRVEDGAIYQGQGIMVHEGSAATVLVKDATLNHDGFALTFNAGTTLQVEGGSLIVGDVLMLAQSVLNLDGEMTINGALTLGLGMQLAGNVLTEVQNLQVGQSITLVSGLESLAVQTQNLMRSVEYTTVMDGYEVQASEYFANLAGNSGLVMQYDSEGGTVSITQTMAVPEPTTATLSLLALAALAARRRRK